MQLMPLGRVTKTVKLPLASDAQTSSNCCGFCSPPPVGCSLYRPSSRSTSASRGRQVMACACAGCGGARAAAPKIMAVEQRRLNMGGLLGSGARMRRCHLVNLGSERARRIKTPDTSACGTRVRGWHRARIASNSATMSDHRLTFSDPVARLQYMLLMGLFRLAVTRGLYGRFARGLGRVFGPDGAVFLHEGGTPPYRIALNDGYWTRFALYRAPYEPEVARVLEAASGTTPLFCDLGANKGYWTTRAAPLFEQVIAVEASAATFAELSGNAYELPNVTLHRAAIHARSGEEMRFVNTHLSHASARLEADLPAGGQDRVETVGTLAVDDLVPEGVAALIKLDVEGAEIAAIRGATRALADGAVLIYEDHGNDPACTVSAHLLEMPGIRLYSIETGLIPMSDVATICACKTDAYKGYNFLAARAGSALLGRIMQGFANSARSG